MGPFVVNHIFIGLIDSNLKFSAVCLNNKIITKTTLKSFAKTSIILFGGIKIMFCFQFNYIVC